MNKRLQRARLLGFKNHAEYILKNHSMVGSPQKVLEFIEEILPKSLEARDKDLKDIEDFARKIENDKDFKLEPWDVDYYSNKLQKEKYNIDTEKIEEYFKLSNVRFGVFSALNKLYGINFIKKEKPSLYYKEDKKEGEVGKSIDGIDEFEVRDKNREFLGRLYIDYFNRDGKMPSCFTTSLKEGYVKLDKNGKIIGYSTPVVAVSFNFYPTLKEENNKPTISSEDDILLTFDNVRTFFHEMGHAINGIFARAKYSSLSFIHSYIDFLELPSLFFENWAFHKNHIYSYAYHYKDTTKVIPKEYVDNIQKVRNFNVGIDISDQIYSTLLDMNWHMIEKEYQGKTKDFERNVAKKEKMNLKDDELRHTAFFNHIVYYNYDARFYSYMWDQMLAMDAFELFKEKGIFNQELANSFRTNILSIANNRDSNKAYRVFRGKEPDSKALMRSFGFIK